MVDFHQFSAHSSSTKKFALMNVNGLSAVLLEIISIVSFDLCNRHFSSTFAAFYGAELSFSSNDHGSLVIWQMLSFQYSSNSQLGYQVFQDGGVFIERSFEALWCSFGLLI